MLEQLYKYYRRSPITTVFIMLSVLLSVITWFGYLPSVLYWFMYDKDLILQGQLWRLVTPIFLHFPALGIIFAHLAFNMIWLYLFGDAIEHAESSRFLLLLIIVAAIVSNIAQAVMSQAIFGGMSGVVYALLGYLFLQGRLNPNYGVNIPNNIAYFLIIYMLVAASGLLGNSIANTAHIVGFLVGLLFAVLKHSYKTN